jgi:hypothetical protein
MFGQRAPGKRLAWFATGDVPTSLTPAGWTLFDAAVTWSLGRGALLVVKDVPLIAADVTLKGRLEALGYLVEPVRGPDLVSSMTTGLTVIVVSESTDSSTILGKLTGATVPVVTLEPRLFADMGLTGPDYGTHWGDLEGQAEVVISDAAHPLAGGNTAGAQVVTSSGQKFVWGVPLGEAQVAVTISGHPDRAAVFGYEAGSATSAGRAPARRVGFFLGRDTAAALNATGARMFDSAIRWAAQPQALLVTASDLISASDEALRTRLTSLGLGVEVAFGPDVTAAQAAGRRLVVISESTLSTTVEDRLRMIEVPVLSLEPALWDNLGMVAATWGTDFGDVQSQQDLNLLLPGHALAAGLTGLVRVTATPEKFLWGTPTATAARVASLAGDASKAAIFAYEAGAAMSGLAAPARRIGFLAGRDAPRSFTAQGWQLFDGAVRWASRLPAVGAAPGICAGRPDGASCDDGDLCNGSETCAQGSCVTGSPPTCTAPSSCATATCLPASGGCTTVPSPVGVGCGDGNVCNGFETCDGQGACRSGTPLSCDDGNPCTADTCGLEGGCDHAPLPSGMACAGLREVNTLDGQCVECASDQVRSGRRCADCRLGSLAVPGENLCACGDHQHRLTDGTCVCDESFVSAPDGQSCIPDVGRKCGTLSTLACTGGEYCLPADLRLTVGDRRVSNCGDYGLFAEETTRTCVTPGCTGER